MNNRKHDHILKYCKGKTLTGRWEQWDELLDE